MLGPMKIPANNIELNLREFSFKINVRMNRSAGGHKLNRFFYHCNHCFSLVCSKMIVVEAQLELVIMDNALRIYKTNLHDESTYSIQH